MIHEIHRELNDLALASGKMLKGQETPFLHYYYGKTETPHQAIPIFENFLYALALCRTKTIEGVQEGKGLIDQLLLYQQPDGLFPIYLHDIPYCQDKYIGAHLLPILYFLYHYFHTVLGNETSTRLKKGMEKLLEVTTKEISHMPLPFKIKAAGALIACGRKADEISEFENFWSSPSRFIPSHMADILTGLILAGSSQKSSLIAWMDKVWHPELQCYTGPFQKMNFLKGNQEITLYDLYMAHFKGEVPKRITSSHPVLLQGALLFPFEFESQTPMPNQESLSFISGKRDPLERGIYPFSFQWGKPTQVKTLVLHPANVSHVNFANQQILCKLGEIPNLEEKEAARELVFYFPLIEDVVIRVNGQGATTFRANDLLSIEDSDIRIEMVFKVSEGTFQGHLSKGNTPTEWMNFGKDRFSAYNWQLFWRTISRPKDCQIAIDFRYELKK